MRAWQLATAGLLVLTWAAPVWTQQPPKRPQPKDDLKVGDPAPDFTLQDVEGKQTVKLSGLKGKPVVLIFGSCT